jgi:rSAM/selenodomain-associated transferase 1
MDQSLAAADAPSPAIAPGDVALVVLAKAPVPGRVKTRLCPPCTHEEAAEVALAALSDTLAATSEVGAGRHVLVLDGEPGGWVPAGFEVLPQRGDGLDERLAAAFDDVAAPALLVGMDTPHAGTDLVERSLARLCDPGVDAVLGPALDGGYWTIGLRRSAPELFHGVPMSSDRTGAEQLRRLVAEGLAVAVTQPLDDIDTFERASRAAAQAPDLLFASAVRRIGALSAPMAGATDRPGRRSPTAAR